MLGPIHCALGCVEPELEPAGEEGRDTRHHPLPTGQARGLKAHGPAVGHMNIAVVGVAHKAVTALLQFLIQIIQQQIGEQRRQHSLNAKGNFRFERTIVDWRSGFVLDLRRKE